jgi:hypothetical protein
MKPGDDINLDTPAFAAWHVEFQEKTNGFAPAVVLAVKAEVREEVEDGSEDTMQLAIAAPCAFDMERKTMLVLMALLQLVEETENDRSRMRLISAVLGGLMQTFPRETTACVYAMLKHKRSEERKN